MKSKRRILLLSLLALIVLGSTATLVHAYYIRSSNDLVYKFSPASSRAPVVGDPTRAFMLDDNVMENTAISVGETNYPVYVRAAIVVTWQRQDDNGGYEVYFQPPVEGTDYIITIGANWIKNDDGFYYYSSPVSSNETTTDLISDLNVINKELDQYKFNVEIIAQTVQAVGSDDSGTPAVKDAWGWDR